MYKVNFPKKWASLILCLFLICSLAVSLVPGTILADDVPKQYVSPYEEIIIDENGNQITKAVFPLPPQKIRVAAATVPDVHIQGVLNSLSDVPAFDWSYGCSATSAAMLFGYYDRTGYSNMYTGPTAGGVCPLDNSVWGVGESPISATHNGLDGRAIKGHVDDYWIVSGATGPDPWVGNWAEHTLGDCTGDYMGTNQWKYGSPVDHNIDGGTTFGWYTNGDPLYDFTVYEPTERDGCHGMKLFAQSRGYTVVTNFSQLIQGQGSDPTKGFTFANFQAEIDAGRPVLIQVVGHTMLGYGYNTTGNIVYIHNTWDHFNYTMTWGGFYSGMQHRAVTVIRLQASPPTVTNSTGASGITDNGARLNGEVTNIGSANPTVHVYWGDNDGGTTAGNWDYDVNLGVKPAGTFYTDISSLISGTDYYYRCYAINSGGGSWAASTASFTTTGVAPQKLIGADPGAPTTSSYPGNYFFLYRFQAVDTGNVVTFKIKTSGSGHVKAAIYADNAGEPGALLSAVNTSTPVVAGWNSITITSTPVVAGTYYWLAYSSDATIGYYYSSGGTLRYKTTTYPTFSFPDPAGTGFNSLSSNGLVAGWGFVVPPSAPTVTNASGASNTGSYSARLNGAITDNGGEDPTTYIYWGLTDEGTTAGSWDHVVNLGTKGVGTFYTDISSLTASTTYYYRCFAENSGDSSWAAATATFDTLPPPTAPTVTNATGADNITDTGARLNGEITLTGGENPTTHIYWGLTDEGTTAGSWDHVVNLGAKGVGTFYTDISGLTAGTTYYYRCYGINSGDSSWAAATATFDTLVTPQKMIGADAGAPTTSSYPGNYFFLYRFQAIETGNVVTFKIKTSGSGNVKTAIYADNAGEPGALLSAVNTSTAVVAGWNSITITSTPVVAGSYYWLAYNSDASIGYYYSSGGTLRYKTTTYPTFSFPDPAGTGFNSSLSSNGLVAGWGFPVPPTPPSAPTLVSPGAAITFKWNASTGATNYHLQVNTSADFTGADIFNAEVGDVTSREVTGFTLGTTYFWRVKAGNAGGWSDWSSVRSVIASNV